MKRKDVQSGIVRSWELVRTLKLGATISSSAPIAINEEFRKVILSVDASYVTIFTTGLRLSHYNFQLTDYSFFQFGWSSLDHVRYSFYPNPFLTDWRVNASALTEWKEQLDCELITRDENLDLLRDLEPEVRVPIVRYENAPDQYKAFNHPCSHLHIGHHEGNRWPLSRILTPLAFTQLILKLYYGSAWQQFGADEADTCGNSLESKLIQERMNCRSIDAGLFTDDREKKLSFFLTRTSAGRQRSRLSIGQSYLSRQTPFRLNSVSYAAIRAASDAGTSMQSVCTNASHFFIASSISGK